MDIPTILTIAAPTALVTAGAAYGSVKSVLNGTKERVKDIHMQLGKHIDDDDSVQRELLQRAAAMEAKLDLLLDRVTKNV